MNPHKPYASRAAHSQLIRDDHATLLWCCGQCDRWTTRLVGQPSAGSPIVGLVTRWDKRVDSGVTRCDRCRGQRATGAPLPRLITPASLPGCASCTPTTARFARRSIWHPSSTGAGSIDIACPLSRVIERLKQALYPKLLPIAQLVGQPPEAPWPDSLDDWLASCHAAGQTRSTALMLEVRAPMTEAAHENEIQTLCLVVTVWRITTPVL